MWSAGCSGLLGCGVTQEWASRHSWQTSWLGSSSSSSDAGGLRHRAHTSSGVNRTLSGFGGLLGAAGAQLLWHQQQLQQQQCHWRLGHHVLPRACSGRQAGCARCLCCIGWELCAHGVWALLLDACFRSSRVYVLLLQTDPMEVVRAWQLYGL